MWSSHRMSKGTSLQCPCCSGAMHWLVCALLRGRWREADHAHSLPVIMIMMRRSFPIGPARWVVASLPSPQASRLSVAPASIFRAPAETMPSSTAKAASSPHASGATRESCDGVELAGLAKRFPAVRKTTDNELSSKLEAHRRAGVKLVDLALKYPDLAAAVWARAEPMLDQHLADKEEQADKFSEQYNKLWRLPGTWKGSWVAQATLGKISDDTMAALVTKANGSQQIIHEIFYYLTATSPNDTLPALCASKKLWSRAFLMRYTNGELSHRADKLSKHIKAKGAVNWSEVGPYKVDFGETGVATKVTHDSGEEAVLQADDTFTRAWTLYECALDMQAYVSAPRTKRNILLSSFFDDATGPKKNIMTLDACATAAHMEIEEEISALQRCLVTDTSSSAIAAATKATKRSAAAARAKSMIAAKKQKMASAGHAFQNA